MGASPFYVLNARGTLKSRRKVSLSLPILMWDTSVHQKSGQPGEVTAGIPRTWFMIPPSGAKSRRSPVGDWEMGHFPKKSRAGVIRGRGAWMLGRRKQQIPILQFFHFSCTGDPGEKKKISFLLVSPSRLQNGSQALAGVYLQHQHTSLFFLAAMIP